jgi:hypothetical protein
VPESAQGGPIDVGSVLVLETLPQPGGMIGIAVGSSTAACASLQQRAGVVDDAQAHAEDAARAERRSSFWADNYKARNMTRASV